MKKGRDINLGLLNFYWVTCVYRTAFLFARTVRRLLGNLNETATGRRPNGNDGR